MAKRSEAILIVDGKVVTVEFDGTHYYVPNFLGQISVVEEHQFDDLNIQQNLSRSVIEIAQKMDFIENPQYNSDYVTYYNVKEIAKKMHTTLEEHWHRLTPKEKESLIPTIGWGMIIHCVTRDPFVEKIIKNLLKKSNNNTIMQNYVIGKEEDYYFYNSEIITKDEFLPLDLDIILDQLSYAGSVFGTACRDFAKFAKQNPTNLIKLHNFFLDQIRIFSRISTQTPSSDDLLCFLKQNQSNFMSIAEKIELIKIILESLKIDFNTGTNKNKVLEFCEILSSAWTKLPNYESVCNVCNQIYIVYKSDPKFDCILVDFYNNLISRIDQMTFLEKVWLTTFF